MGKYFANWKSYIALQQAIGRNTAEVAKNLKLTKTTVGKWKEAPSCEDFHNSGSLNPLDRIESIIKSVEKIDVKRAYLPLFWLCSRFGFLQPRKLDGSRIAKNFDPLDAVLSWNEGFGDTAAEIRKALECGKITQSELDGIYKKAISHIHSVLAVVNAMEIKKTRV